MQDDLTKMQKNGVDMLNHFSKIYDSVHEANRKSVPYQTARLYDAAKRSLKNVKTDLEPCVQLKSCGERKSNRVLCFYCPYGRPNLETGQRIYGNHGKRGFQYL